MQTVMLPECLEKEFHELTEGKLDLLGIDRDHLEYKKRYKKIFYEYCKEAYEESMTPASHLKSNPTTPKVPKDIVELFYLTSMKGFIKDFGSDLDNTHAKFIQSQFRGALSSLTNLLLKFRYGFKVKKKNGKPSDFEYLPMKGEDTEGKKDMMIQVELNRRFRYAVLAMLTAHIEKFFKNPNFTKDALNKMIDQQIPRNETGKITHRALRNKVSQKEFAKHFYDLVINGDVK